MDQDLYAPDDLEKFALDILIAGGMRAADAGIAASSLVAANLRGVGYTRDPICPRLRQLHAARIDESSP